VKPGSGTAGTFAIATSDSEGHLFDDTRFGDEAGPATSRAGIAPTFGALGEVALTSPLAGTVGGFVVQITTVGEVEADGKITMVFPAGFQIANATVHTPTGRLWLSQQLQVFSNQTGPLCMTATACGGGVIIVSNFKTIAPGELSFTLGNIRAPATGMRHFAVETGDVLGYTIDRALGGVQVSAATGRLTGVEVAVPAAGVQGDVEFGLSTSGQIPPDGSITIEFPSHTADGYPSAYVLGAVVLHRGEYQTEGVLTGNINVNVSGQVVTLSGFNLVATGTMQFTLRNIRSPGSAPSAGFIIRTHDALGRWIDTEDLASATPSIGTLTAVAVLLPQAGVTGAVNVSFATQGSILGAGKVKIQFPGGLLLPAAMTASLLGGG